MPMAVWVSFLIFCSIRKIEEYSNTSDLNYFSLAVRKQIQYYDNWGGCQIGNEIAMSDEDR